MEIFTLVQKFCFPYIFINIIFTAIQINTFQTKKMIFPENDTVTKILNYDFYLL